MGNFRMQRHSVGRFHIIAVSPWDPYRTPGDVRRESQNRCKPVGRVELFAKPIALAITTYWSLASCDDGRPRWHEIISPPNPVRTAGDTHQDPAPGTACCRAPFLQFDTTRHDKA